MSTVYIALRSRTEQIKPVMSVLGATLDPDKVEDLMLSLTPTDRRIEWDPTRKVVNVYGDDGHIESVTCVVEALLI